MCLGDDYCPCVFIGNIERNALHEETVVSPVFALDAMIDSTAAPFELCADDALRDVSRNYEVVAAQTTNDGRQHAGAGA